MSTENKATETLLRRTETVHIGEENLNVSTFCVAKTLKAFEYMAALTEAVGLQSIVGGALSADANGEFAGESPISSTFINRILSVLPTALRTGVRPLYQLIGLIVTSNSRLAALEDGNESVDDYLFIEGRRLAREATTPEIIELVMAGSRALGVETILGNVTALLSAARSS